MSSVFATSSYSDLDARTEFVLNRVAFLESVRVVLNYEHTPENMQKVAVLRDNNYIPLIVRCIMDPNEEIYDRAIWATAYLIGSDDQEVATMTRAAITDDLLKRLVELAGRIPLSDVRALSQSVRNGIYYLIGNLSSYDYAMPRFFTEVVGNISLMQIMLADQNPKHRTIMFLDTVKKIAAKDPGAINSLFLIDALFKPELSQYHSQLFHIIGTLAGHDSMICSLGISKLMTYFIEQLTSDDDNVNTNITRQEMLWVLSNIMTEPSAPAYFVGEHKELKSLVESIAWVELAFNEEADEAVGYEVLFALANYVGSKHLSEEFKENIANDDDLAALFGACLDHDNAKIAAVAREGFDLISQMISTFCPDKYCEDCGETSCGGDDVHAIKKLVETHCDECCEENCDDENCDNEICDDTENDAPPHESVYGLCEKPVPSASDLVLGERRGNESAAVRRVVSLLVDSPAGEWVEVPSDWTLTISDLTTLQHLGYTIKDGYVGINPEIYAEY
jgi:hypothetical protein